MDNDKRALYFRFFNEIGIISQLSRAMMDARLPDGVTTSHFGVLNHLIRVQDGRTPLALARAFQVPKTTMTHTLGGLEKLGFITLSPNPEDGRSKLVWITEKGRAFRDQSIVALDDAMVGFAETFSDADMESLIPGLQAIREYMDKARD